MIIIYVFSYCHCYQAAPVQARQDPQVSTRITISYHSCYLIDCIACLVMLGESLHTFIYIYIYRERERDVHVSLSLSLSLYVYTYAHTCIFSVQARQDPQVSAGDSCGTCLPTKVFFSGGLFFHRHRYDHTEITIVAIFYPFSQFCEISISLLSLQTQPNTAPNLFQRGVEYGKYDHLHARCPSSSAKPRRATKEGQWVLRIPPAY